MEDKKDLREKKQVYEEPKILATYKKEDLEEAVMPHGQTGGGCGCGCGCGCS
jgi:hypothetical protein